MSEMCQAWMWALRAASRGPKVKCATTLVAPATPIGTAMDVTQKFTEGEPTVANRWPAPP